MSVVEEFCDDNNNTYQIIEWDNYLEVSLVLVNIDKRTKDIMVLGSVKDG